jgi:hydrogenase nickel incorporation protein HypA/HybF
MHEMSLATALIDQVLAAASRSGLARVVEVEVDVGALQLVVAEALEAAFAAVSADTIASGAVLRQIEVPAQARCRCCDREYQPEIHIYTCPVCGRADAEILSGRDIILKSISGHEENEVAHEDQGH